MVKFSRLDDDCSHLNYIRKALDALPFTKDYKIIGVMPGESVRVSSDKVGMLIYVEPHDLNKYEQ